MEHLVRMIAKIGDCDLERLITLPFPPEGGIDIDFPNLAESVRLESVSYDATARMFNCHVEVCRAPRLTDEQEIANCRTNGWEDLGASANEEARRSVANAKLAATFTDDDVRRSMKVADAAREAARGRMLTEGMTSELRYFHAEHKSPPDGSVKLVLAWERLDQPFWTFAAFEGGKWIEKRGTNKDLTDDVEFWFELPPVGSIGDDLDGD